jgi:hypothetical protein
MGFIILRLWDWCFKSKGFRKKPEYDLIKQFSRRLEKSFVELSLRQFRHHTRQLTVTNPSFLNDNRKKEQQTANSRFAKVGVSCFYESEVLNSSFLHLMKFSVKNPRLRKASNRYKKS